MIQKLVINFDNPRSSSDENSKFVLITWLLCNKNISDNLLRKSCHRGNEITISKTALHDIMKISEKGRIWVLFLQFNPVNLASCKVPQIGIDMVKRTKTEPK